MIFRSDGSIYDTAEMLAFPAGPQTVYATPDFKAAFVQSRDETAGVRIQRLDESAIRHLAQQYALPDLLKAIASACPQPAILTQHPHDGQ